MASEPQLAGLTSYYNTVAPSSASANPISLQESGTVLQADMKNRAGEGLRGRTYFADLTAKDGIFYADPTIVANVTNSLSTTLGALTSEGVSSAIEPRIPNGGFTLEKPSYGPVSHLINKIIDTAEPHIQQSHLRGLRFHPFGFEVNELYGSRKRLKPDGVGIIGNLPERGGKDSAGAKKVALSWEQVEVVFESKDSATHLVEQSATYARCCALGNPRRFFSIGIGFEFKKLEAYFFVFHRDGLLSSPPFVVTEADGFKGLVSHIVGILSLKDEAAFGLDTTRFEKWFYINYQCFEIVRPIYIRGSLQGRSTTVFRLQGTYMRILNAGFNLFIAYSAVNSTPRDMESRVLTLSRIDRLPDKITYKQTYQIRGHSQEGPLFSQFTGRFGIADVIGYHECGIEDPHGSTMRLMNGAEYWNVLGSQDKSRAPGDRGLHCIALSGGGRALVDLGDTDGGTPSPGDLLESILHAIIGK